MTNPEEIQATLDHVNSKVLTQSDDAIQETFLKFMDEQASPEEFGFTCEGEEEGEEEREEEREEDFEEDFEEEGREEGME